LKFKKSDRVAPGSPSLSEFGSESVRSCTRLYLASMPVFRLCCFQRRVERSLLSVNTPVLRFE
jgi:hypothetical protein